ncbi:MAG: hypothetical protein ACI4V7_03760 [Succinivibrionaceae bacterium]
MPIPQHILDVARPKNTIVIAYGVNKDKFAVRQRIGCKRKNGRNVPVNGPTIGHIINNQYVPKKDESKTSVSKKVQSSNHKIDLKDWANIAICDEIFKDILSELKEFYCTEDVMKIYAISLLRVCYPGVKDYELKEF